VNGFKLDFCAVPAGFGAGGLPVGLGWYEVAPNPCVPNIIIAKTLNGTIRPLYALILTLPSIRKIKKS
jgi:hypothetical protein